MTENEIAREVVDAAFAVHKELGPGLLESAYESVLAYELTTRGFTVSRQVLFGIKYRDIIINEGFRADLIVNDLLLVELKSVESILPVHSKQLLTYLKLTDRKLGLLINFNEALIKNGISRVINGRLD